MHVGGHQTEEKRGEKMKYIEKKEIFFWNTRGWKKSVEWRPFSSSQQTAAVASVTQKSQQSTAIFSLSQNSVTRAHIWSGSIVK